MRAATQRLCQAATIPVRLQGVEHHLQPLRLRLSDPARFTPNRQRLFEISSVLDSPAAYQVAKSSFQEGRGLEVQWGDGEASFFPMEWLAAQLSDAADTTETMPKPDLPYLWNARFRKFLPEIAYADVCSAEGKAKLSVHLLRYGIALIKNVPCELGMVQEVGNEVGFVRTTNYGAIFDVIDLGSDGNNLAQTNCRILAHTDNPYRDPFPGVQLLHCLSNATAGGATNFTDGFAAAHMLRRRNPAAFEILARHPHPYEYRDPTQGVLLQAAAPVISIDSDGQISRICLNNRSAGVIDLPQAKLEEYYRAWAAFDSICNSEEFVMPVALRPGDLAIFLNSRIMHGREEYTPGAGRHIQGCYIDHDSVRSRAAAIAVNDVDAHAAVTDRILEALATQSEFQYGEGVDMLQHALQAAQIASLEGEPAEAVLAALMHDVGNAPQARAVWEAMGRQTELMVSPSDNSIGYRHHSDIGAAFLEEAGFAPAVVGAVRLHVEAKRALVAADPGYMKELSQASIDTLAQQGGPLSTTEFAAFRATPGADVAMQLRRYDDQGKVAGADVPQLQSYRELIYNHLRMQSSIPK